MPQPLVQPNPWHPECSDRCMCWALGCPCDHCAPIWARVDQLITDERQADKEK